MSLDLVVGFDYRQTVLELSHRMRYREIAKRIGYKNASAVHRLMSAQQIPSHVHGEALWALYVEIFGKKPPHTEAQAKGIPKATEITV